MPAKEFYTRKSDIGYAINTPDYRIPESVTLNILRESNPLLYHKSLTEYMPTPLVHLRGLSEYLEVGEIYVKDESQRLGLNAFKALGASYAISQVMAKSPLVRPVFCSATDGNHGRAVAWAARKTGCSSKIFVPKGTATSRIEAIRNEGAEVIVTDGNYDYTCEIAKRTGSEKGWHLLQDTAWKGYEEVPAMIMAGYTTLFREIDAELKRDNLPGFDIVFLQAGVGSFAASAAWYYSYFHPSNCPKFIVAEPSESDGLLESFKNMAPSTPCGPQKTIMAGLNCGIPSSTAWDILLHCCDASVRISDSDAIEAMRMLYYPFGNDPVIMSGESGAAGLGALTRVLSDSNLNPVKEHIALGSGSRILIINTEGATDPAFFNKTVVNSKIIR